MVEAKRMNPLVINVLPPEMVEEILKHLNFQEIKQARLICKRWEEIIGNGNLVRKASGMIFSHVFK